LTRLHIRVLIASGICLGAIASAGEARAQTRTWPERTWISISGGAQPAVEPLADAFEVPLYAEVERVTVGYPGKAGSLIAASGGYRVWKQLTLGLGFTRASGRSPASVSAQLPHPFFDNRFREVEGTTSTQRGENAVHLLIGWLVPVSNRIRVIVTTGPSTIGVEQTAVTAVQFSESYPYDAAEFTGATTKRASSRAAGFNAGADLTWMFSRRIGAGGLVQFTRARARIDAGGGRTIGVDAGGVQIGAGVRIIF